MARNRSKIHPAASQPRRDRGEPATTGAYTLTRKLPEPSACNACGAIYRAGRWQWGDMPSDSRLVQCPACRRIADHYPAGILTLAGGFAQENTAEIRRLISNLAERERERHPMKRVMEMRDEAGVLTVTTTEARLARALGEAVHAAFQGVLDYRPADTEPTLRVSWLRD